MYNTHQKSFQNATGKIDYTLMNDSTIAEKDSTIAMLQAKLAKYEK